ncbi:MAG: hypothetical protein EA350_17660 [Gemmatimonadales bacterium]|nr:MAG: hypothetical protein EA350_17660 [Gemmatimonadales bacterium]
MTRAGLLAGTLLVVPTLAMPAAGQTSPLLPMQVERGFSVEVAHPSFKELEMTAATSVWHLGGSLPLLVPGLRAVIDVPVAYAALDGALGELSGSSTVLGNPYLGVEYSLRSFLVLEGGIRAPLTTADAESYADVVGFLADVSRGEAFLEDVFPVALGARVEHRIRPDLSLTARLGTVQAFYTGDDEDLSSTTFVDYGVGTNWTRGAARVGAGVGGRWDASTDEGKFGENSLHQLGITADVALGPVRPGLSLRVPLDQDHRDILKASVGAYVQIPLR